MEYYSAIKRNEIGSFVETWVDLESVIQSEVIRRSEEHTSELQSHHDLVCRLLLEKKKDIFTTMFTAALFTIAWSWKQPKCPSSDE